MTIKKQFEIMKKLSEQYNGYYGLNTSRRIRTTIDTIDYVLNNLGEKTYIGEYQGYGRHCHFEISYAIIIIRQFIDIKEKGNDAPRGGQHGDYVIFKKNNVSKEILEFIKSILKTMI